MPHFNDEFPDWEDPAAIPTEAIAGELSDDATVDSMMEALASHGIDEDRVHVLNGQAGIGFLQNAGTALGRLFAPDRDVPIARLEDGAALVAIYGVQEADQDSAIEAARAAGVKIVRRFGKWTYT